MSQESLHPTSVSPADILAFWFAPETKPFWFEKNREFDDRVRERLLHPHEAAATGSLDHWRNDPAGCLAHVILLDQVPRNVFRGDARMFATDAEALATARHAVARDFDQGFDSDRRLFLYLPFEHSEALADQEACVALMRDRTGNPRYIDYARRHLRIIERFGRFPHRNAVLGRKSTPEELVFLEEPGSSF